MKYLRQFLWIAAFTALGELLNYLLPFPVPAGVYGLVLLFAALCLGLIQLDKVENAGDFLVETMAVMFMPAMASLLVKYALIKDVLPKYLLVVVLSLVIVMSVTALVMDAMVRRQK